MARVVCHLPTGLFLDIPDPNRKGHEIRAATLAFGLNEIDDGVWKAWLAVHGHNDALMSQVVEIPEPADAGPAPKTVAPAKGSAAERAGARAAKGN